MNYLNDPLSVVLINNNLIILINQIKARVLLIKSDVILVWTVIWDLVQLPLCGLGLSFSLRCFFCPSGVFLTWWMCHRTTRVTLKERCEQRPSRPRPGRQAGLRTLRGGPRASAQRSSRARGRSRGPRRIWESRDRGLWPPRGARGSCAPPPRPSAARPTGGCFSQEPGASRTAGGGRKRRAGPGGPCGGAPGAERVGGGAPQLRR